MQERAYDYTIQKRKNGMFTFFGMPGEHTGLWEGEKIDNTMLMKQKRFGPNGESLESRLTFYNIGKTSFDWKDELWDLNNNTVTVNWKIKAVKN